MWEREEKQKSAEHFEGANERKRVSQIPHILQPCEADCLFWERTHCCCTLVVAGVALTGSTTASP